MTENQSLRTDSRTSLNTKTLDELAKLQADIGNRHGIVRAKKPVIEQEFVPEISVCKVHGKYESTFRGVSMSGRAGRIFPRSCPECAKENQIKQEEFIKKGEIDHKLKNSGVPKRHFGKKIEDVDQSDQNVRAAVSAISGYIANMERVLKNGSSGFFCGECGTGKTMLACMVVEDAIRKGFRARYITAWNMIQEIRLGYSATDVPIVGQIKNLISYDLLVIDEIGVQHGTDDERVLLYQVIDGRYNEIKPTVLISNSKDPVDDGYLDARTIDRLKEGGGFSMTFTGKSYRK
jgi:DNA replication protein DnaC